MPKYDNIRKPGVVTSTSGNPRTLKEDIDYMVRELMPTSAPMQYIGNKIGRGPKPISNKVQVMYAHAFDRWDTCSSVVFGSGAETRYANMVMDNVSRPTTKSLPYYQPQDTFLIVATNQMVQVVINENGSMPLDNNGNYFAMADATLTGNTTTKTLAGHILVQNVEPDPLLPFTTTDVIYMGRVFFESQDINPPSFEDSVMFDHNYVMRLEAGIQFTEDQVQWIKSETPYVGWDASKKRELANIAGAVEEQAMHGKRALDMQGARVKGFMRGFDDFIKSNVSYWNPALTQTTDFEILFQNFMIDQVNYFGAAEYANVPKIALCGRRVLATFGNAFREYRRAAMPLDKEVGIKADTYVLNDERIQLMKAGGLRTGKIYENWIYVLAPNYVEWRIVKDYTSKMYSNNNERDQKWAVEWIGTMALHLEQMHAALKTYV